VGVSPRFGAGVAERVADVMFALSAPSRVLILGCLLDGPATVKDLMAALSMEQSAVSHQLRVLREYELVAAERVGRTRVYALRDEHVRDLLEGAVDHVERERGRASKHRRASGRAGG
jgi:ArsR family transcriptional regulator, nickel/cobalt-responsive transcriptional repressor